MGMMDRDDSIRGGFQAAFPGVPVRLCQYHLIRQIRARFHTYYGNDKLGKKRIEKALAAFRRCQRVTKAEHFESYYAKLRDTIQSIDPENGRANWQDFDAYVMGRGAWLAPHWRPASCDFGLPSGMLRDQYMSTNNATERAFCTFDGTFLCARMNKR